MARDRKIVRTFSANAEELKMLEVLARYHGFSKSATITSLIKKEFWRVFPRGTAEVVPHPGARVSGEKGAEGRESERRDAGTTLRSVEPR